MVFSLLFSSLWLPSCSMIGFNWCQRFGWKIDRFQSLVCFPRSRNSLKLHWNRRKESQWKGVHFRNGMHSIFDIKWSTNRTKPKMRSEQFHFIRQVLVNEQQYNKVSRKCSNETWYWLFLGHHLIWFDLILAVVLLLWIVISNRNASFFSIIFGANDLSLVPFCLQFECIAMMSVKEQFICWFFLLFIFS